ncbi:MAG TPA: hypothetical protein VK081_10645 [Planctomycetota bacterium]|nr:hypothetical protein [Planctomycetota bacterium]
MSRPAIVYALLVVAVGAVAAAHASFPLPPAMTSDRVSALTHAPAGLRPALLVAACELRAAAAARAPVVLRAAVAATLVVALALAAGECTAHLAAGTVPLLARTGDENDAWLSAIRPARWTTGWLAAVACAAVFLPNAPRRLRTEFWMGTALGASLGDALGEYYALHRCPAPRAVGALTMVAVMAMVLGLPLPEPSQRSSERLLFAALCACGTAAGILRTRSARLAREMAGR